MESQEVKICVGDLRLILASKQGLLSSVRGLDADETVKVKILAKQVMVTVERTGEKRVNNK